MMLYTFVGFCVPVIAVLFANEQLTLSQALSIVVTFLMGLITREGWRIRKYVFDTWERLRLFVEFAKNFKAELREKLDAADSELSKAQAAVSPEMQPAVTAIRNVISGVRRLSDSTIIEGKTRWTR